MTNQRSTIYTGNQQYPNLAIKIISVALAYFASGRLGLEIPYLDAHITLSWLPAGIAFAALIRWGYYCWPGIFLGALAANYSADSPLLLEVCIALGNTLAPLLAAKLLHRTQFHGALEKRVLGPDYDVFILWIFIYLGCPAPDESNAVFPGSNLVKLLMKFF